MIAECARVHQTAESLQKGNLSEVGRLLNASHQSLRDDFEVSCAELDFLAKQTENTQAVLGARMMGGGFGGCLLALVKQQESQIFKDQIQAAYEKEFRLTPAFIDVAVGDGARKI